MLDLIICESDSTLLYGNISSFHLDSCSPSCQIFPLWTQLGAAESDRNALLRLEYINYLVSSGLFNNKLE